MTYRNAIPDRLYVCPGCGSAERASVLGGKFACTRCHQVTALPDRTALPTSDVAFQPPPTDITREDYLDDMEPEPPRPLMTSLEAVVAAKFVQEGDAQEALELWRALLGPAQRGGIVASEDFSALTLKLVQMVSMMPNAALCEALSETAFDVLWLPCRAQEQLGYLARAAVAKGDRRRARQYLAWMFPWTRSLVMDSELRVSAAAFATLEGDGQRVLEMLGRRRGDMPIVASLDVLASVLRANAHELLGDPAAAAEVLRELPEAGLLGLIAERFPALRLCAQSGPIYAATARYEADLQVRASAVGDSQVVGSAFVLMSVLILLVSFIAARRGVPIGIGILVLGVVPLAVGAALAVGGLRKGARAARLRASSIPLPARIVRADPTEANVDDVPVWQFKLQVAGPEGRYEATVVKPMPEHQLPLLVGEEVWVRAHPENPQQVVYE